MKEVYIKDIHARLPGCEVVLFGWISAKRCQEKIIFLDVCDSTGTIQAVVEKKQIGQNQFDLFNELPVEAAIAINGVVKIHDTQKEISVLRIYIVGKVTKKISPTPRGHIDIFNENLTDHLLKNRHLYLRNPKVMAVLKFRDTVMRHTRNWFYQNQFTSIDAPILTPTPLYEDDSTIHVNIHGDEVFLTQCVGYYLEAAVHAFERVYNMGPSFRGEESRSKRHLMEYWHIKAEIAWANLEDIIHIVERLLHDVIDVCWKEGGDIIKPLERPICTDGMHPPFPRIPYEDAINHLSSEGFSIAFGKGLGSDEEASLSKLFPGKPFWVTGIPRIVEPFPYVIDQEDPRITRA